MSPKNRTNCFNIFEYALKCYKKEKGQRTMSPSTILRIQKPFKPLHKHRHMITVNQGMVYIYRKN
jgi:hypothetical protein